MAQLGADVEALDQLAKLFQKEAKEMQGALATITSKVNAVWWKGKDADGFRSDWTGQHRPALQKLVTMLETTSAAVKKEAQQQRAASGQG